MLAGVLFTGTGPMLILTSHASLTAPALAEKLAGKGIDKYVACEVTLDLVKERYGAQYDRVLGDLQQTDDLRVLDFNGHHVLGRFSLRELGRPIICERDQELAAAE